MCTNALAESRVKNVYYLLESTYHLNNYSLPSKVNFYKIDDKFKYSKILSDFFFKIKRKK